MKILAIKGENIASLAAPFEVRFDAPPLSNTGLFAITGNTGAGKTSLLDALCLALFDDTPRLGKSRGDKRERDGISTSDPRNLLTTGASAGYAEVSFVGSDQTAYRARWSVRRARNRSDGRLQAQQLDLYEGATGKLISAGRKRDTLHKIEQCLGLDFQQFQRSVLLPQGDFAQFLKANESERAELLEQITGTEIYSRVSVLAHEKSREWSDKLAAEQARLALDMPLEESARNELQQQREQLSRELDQRQARLDALNQQLAWYRDRQQVTEKISAVQEERRSAMTAVAALKPRREKLTAVKSAQPLRSEYDHLQMLQENIQQLDRDKTALQQNKAELDEKIARLKEQLESTESAYEAARAARLKAGPELAEALHMDEQLEQLKAENKQKNREILEREKQLEKKEKEHESIISDLKTFRVEVTELDRYFRTHEYLEKIAADHARVEHLLQRYGDAESQLASEEGHLKALAARRIKLDSEQSAVRQQYERLRETLQVEEASLEKLLEKSRQHDLKDLRAAREKWQQKLDKLQALGSLLDETARLKESSAELRSRLKAIDDILKEAEIEQQQVQENLNRAEAARTESAGALRLTLLASKEDAKTLRAQLAPGQPCAVCGSEDHPWASHSPALDGLLSEQQKRHEELEKEEAKWLEAGIKVNSLIEQKSAERIKTKEELTQTGELLENLSRKWKISGETGLAGDLSDASSREALLKSLEQTRASLANVTDKEKQALVFIDEIRKAEKSAGELRSKLRNQERRLDQMSVQQKEIEAEQKPVMMEKQRCERELPELKAQLGEFFDPAMLMGNISELMDKTRSEVTLLNKKKQRWEALKQQISESDNRLKVIQVEREHARKSLEQLKTDREQTDARYKAMLDQRLALFGGQAVALVTRKLEEEEAGAKQARDQAADAVQQAMQESHSLDALIGEKRLSRQRSREDVAAIEARLRENAESRKLGFGALVDLLALGADWVDAEQSEIEKVDALASETEVRLREWREQLHKHMEKGIPEQKENQLQKEVDEQQQALEGLRKQAAELDVLVKQDDARREQLEKQNRELLDLQNQAEIWQKMKAVIGSADGSRFRNFAQSVTLDSLVSYANTHLMELARRYRIERIAGSDLGIEVVDTEMGDERRSVYSLSGGESFLVSLALALGLSSLSAVRTPVETLFIDEGFGSLDSRTLDTALAALDTLQAQGRKIGVISHVNALVERIGVQVKVAAASAGHSQITVTG